MNWSLTFTLAMLAFYAVMITLSLWSQRKLRQGRSRVTEMSERSERLYEQTIDVHARVVANGLFMNLAAVEQWRPAVEAYRSGDRAAFARTTPALYAAARRIDPEVPRSSDDDYWEITARISDAMVKMVTINRGS